MWILVAHGLNEPLLLGLGNAAELGLHLPTLQRVEHGRRLQEEHAFEAVEIGQALFEIVLVALAGDVAALDVLDECEGSGAVDVKSSANSDFFILRRVDEVPGRPEMLEDCRIHPL